MTFDDEHPPLDRPPLTTTRRKPPGWVEEALVAGWRAALAPSRRFLWVVPLASVPLLLVVLAHATRGIAISALEVLALVVMAATFSAYHLRRWSFAFENGRFRVDARGLHEDIGVEDILGFIVEAPPKKRDLTSPWTAGAFQLRVVRLDERRITIPLFVRSPAEAQFVANRLNQVLASGGRRGNFGYRGEPLRVAAEEPDHRVDATEPALEEEDPEDEREVGARARR